MRRQIGFGGGRHASTHNAAVGCGRPRDAGDGGCKDGRGQPGNAARTSSWSCLHVLYPLLRLFLRYILPGLLILLVLSAVLTGVGARQLAEGVYLEQADKACAGHRPRDQDEFRLGSDSVLETSGAAHRVIRAESVGSALICAHRTEPSLLPSLQCSQRRSQ